MLETALSILKILFEYVLSLREGAAYPEFGRFVVDTDGEDTEWVFNAQEGGS